MQIDNHGIRKINGTNYIVLYEKEYAEWWFLPILKRDSVKDEATGPGFGPIFANSITKAIKALKRKMANMKKERNNE